MYVWLTKLMSISAYNITLILGTALEVSTGKLAINNLL